MTQPKSLYWALAALWLVGLPGCRSDSDESLRLLVERGYTFSLEEFGRAAEDGDIAALECFLNAGVRIDAEDEQGRTAWLRAIAAAKDGTAAWLWDRGGVSSSVPPEAWELAIEAKSTPTLRLLEERAETDGRSELLRLAVENGWLDGLEVMLEKKGEGDDLRLALHEAINSSRLAVTSLLIGAGADVNAAIAANGLPPLFSAVLQGDLEMVQLLVANGAGRGVGAGNIKAAADFAEQAGFPSIEQWLRKRANAQPER